jgi:hypothetical protein
MLKLIRKIVKEIKEKNRPESLTVAYLEVNYWRR